jgi:hypothetical protein
MDYSENYERIVLHKIFNRNRNERLDMLINAVADSLLTMDTNDEDYDETLAYLERLMRLRGEPPKALSHDTIAMVVGNLVGIAFIVAYEQKHVLSTKALGWWRMASLK